MPTINASFSRDNNRIPITTDGITLPSNIQVLTGNNTTVVTPIFHIIGTVEIRGLWGIVTTVIGANHTAGFYRLNDQTAQVNITASGVTLSGLAAGTTMTKHGLAAAALTLLDNSAGRVSEPTTLETTYFSPFLAMKKTGATTDIEYSYATTDTPTSGAIQHFVRFIPVSSDGNVIAI